MRRFLLILLTVFGISFYSIKAQLNRIDEPYKIKNLSGKILAPDDKPLNNCLVERLNSDWKKAIEVITTNSDGKFKFSKLESGIFYLRISCTMFQTYEIKVITNRKTKENLVLKLELAI